MTEWQRMTWNIFHTIALNYNDKYKNEYIEFFNTFKIIIPCSMCRNHYINHVNNDNLNIENNINNNRVFDWTIDLHNTVNKMNNKKQWSYEEALNFYKINNFNNRMFKFFIFEYIKLNFKKNPSKTQELLKMLRTLPYLHPNEEKRNKLIDFKDKFELNRGTVKNWIYAFLIILKS